MGAEEIGWLEVTDVGAASVERVLEGEELVEDELESSMMVGNPVGLLPAPGEGDLEDSLVRLENLVLAPLLPRLKGDGLLLGALLGAGDGVLLCPLLVKLGALPHRFRLDPVPGVIIVGSMYESLLGCFVP